MTPGPQGGTGDRYEVKISRFMRRAMAAPFLDIDLSLRWKGTAFLTVSLTLYGAVDGAFAMPCSAGCLARNHRSSRASASH